MIIRYCGPDGRRTPGTVRVAHSAIVDSGREAFRLHLDAINAAQPGGHHPGDLVDFVPEALSLRLLKMKASPIDLEPVVSGIDQAINADQVPHVGDRAAAHDADRAIRVSSDRLDRRPGRGGQVREPRAVGDWSDRSVEVQEQQDMRGFFDAVLISSSTSSNGGGLSIKTSDGKRDAAIYEAGPTASMSILNSVEMILPAQR